MSTPTLKQWEVLFRAVCYKMPKNIEGSSREWVRGNYPKISENSSQPHQKHFKDIEIHVGSMFNRPLSDMALYLIETGIPAERFIAKWRLDNGY